MTVIAAWWGAGIATVTLIFNVIKWFSSGPKICISANYNMNFVGEDETKYLIIAASNIGDQKTEISLLSARYYANLFKYILKKPSKNMILIPNEQGDTLPSEINPGAQKKFLIRQNRSEPDMFENMVKNGYLEIFLSYIHSTKPIRIRLKAK